MVDMLELGIVLSPYMVGFMKPGKLWNKKRSGLLFLSRCITILSVATNTNSRVRLRLGVLAITVGKKVGVDVPVNRGTIFG